MEGRSRRISPRHMEEILGQGPVGSGPNPTGRSYAYEKAWNMKGFVRFGGQNRHWHCTYWIRGEAGRQAPPMTVYRCGEEEFERLVRNVSYIRLTGMEPGALS